MATQGKLKSYATRLQKKLQSRAIRDFGMITKIYPSRNAGAIFEISFNKERQFDIRFAPTTETVSVSLEKIKQKAIGGNLRNITFGGTSIIGEPNRIIIIKGNDDKDLFGDDALENDFERIMGFGKKKVA